MKGLNQNTRPQKQPEGTYRFGKNGLANQHLGTVENEPGWLPSAAQIPYVFCGCIVTPKFPVIFSTDNVNSAIGYFDTENDVYVPILDDATMDFKLGFDTDRYITGQSQLNYKGDVVIAFTDKHRILWYLNCDDPDVTALQDLNLFPVMTAPTINLNQDGGGVLAPGAYFAAVRYAKEDGTITAFASISGVSMIAGNVAAVSTDRSLVILLDNLDTRYDFVEVAIIFKSQGVFTTPQLLSPISITGPSMRLIYSGGELTSDIPLENILIPQATYVKAGTIGQLNDALYIGDLESEEPINMQPWANLIQVQWKSELMDVMNPDPDHVQGEKRSFMHEEVVALYIQYAKTTGGWTPWFHIPGRPPSAGDLLTSTLGTAQGLTEPKFRLEDTVTNVQGNYGSMGVWQNENETYPDHPDFDSSAIGGSDLRGQPVCHHRFPSLRLCKQLLYAGDNRYGKTHLDLLGLKVLNVQIPEQYADKISGWRIGFAKRTLSNSLVQGQGLVMHAAEEGAWNGGSPVPTGNATKLVSTGGNFHAGNGSLIGAMTNVLAVNPSTMRFHAFDLLFNKPALAGSGYYLSSQLKVGYQLTLDDLIEDYNLGFNDVWGPIVYKIDYPSGAINPVLPTDSYWYRNLSGLQLVSNNLLVGNWFNKDLETCYGAMLSNPLALPAEISMQRVNMADNEANQTGKPLFEVAHLANLMRLRTDLYMPFTGQKLIVSSPTLTGATGEFFGGDTYIGPYTFHTYGWWNKDNERLEPEIGGTKVVRRFVCEAASNLHARFETPGNEYSKWYPNNPLIRDDTNNYITNFRTAIDPNQIGYSNDFNTLNELAADVGVYNTLTLYNNLHPFRIARGGKLGRQDKTRSWRTWLPLDYYEMVKTFGRVINLDGQDDRLLIHMEKALMMTQDKTKLESDVLSITLGTADIFQFEPQDVQSAPLGYAGTIHDLACVRTPFGYFSVDAASGEMFWLKKGLENQGKGLAVMLRDMLKVIPRNVLQGDGITIGYDPYYKRILLTVKKKTKSNKIIYEPTDEQIANLEPGDHVYMHGRILVYGGLNDTAYTCPGQPQVPVVASPVLEFSPGQYFDQVIYTVSGIYVESTALVGVAPASSMIFSYNPATKQVLMTGELSPFIGQYTLFMEATSATGDTTAFTITINVVA